MRSTKKLRSGDMKNPQSGVLRRWYYGHCIIFARALHNTSNGKYSPYITYLHSAKFRNNADYWHAYVRHGNKSVDGQGVHGTPIPPISERVKRDIVGHNHIIGYTNKRVNPKILKQFNSDEQLYKKAVNLINAHREFFGLEP
jgi:hypothetical protein